jgi:hypothetical protein
MNNFVRLNKSYNCKMCNFSFSSLGFLNVLKKDLQICRVCYAVHFNSAENLNDIVDHHKGK